MNEYVKNPEYNKFIEAWGYNPTVSQPQIVNPTINNGEQ